MPAEFYIYLLMGAMVGGLVNGLAGFGTSLFALSFWLQILEPVQAVSVVVVVAVISSQQGLWLVRHAIPQQRKRILRLVVPAIIGTPIGISVLTLIEPTVLKLTIAVIMLLYGGFFILRRNMPKFAKVTPVADAFVGFISGIIGGATSLCGVLPLMWCALRPWGKTQTRAILQPFNAIILTLTMVFLAFKGVYTWETFKLIVIALPATMLSAQIGIFIFKRLNDNQFRFLLVSLMFLSGVILLARELLS